MITYAESILTKNNIELSDPNYLKLKSFFEQERKLGYVGKFTEMMFIEKVKYDNLINLYNGIKTSKINININEIKVNKKSIHEQITDLIELKERNNKADWFIYMMPLKLKEYFRIEINYIQLRDTILNLDKDFLRNGGFHETYKKEDGELKHGKWLKYKNGKEVLTEIGNLLKNTSSKESILDKIKKSKAKIVYNENGYVVAEIPNFETSELLGSNAWCIQRNEEYFEEYKNNINIIYFIWNFNLPQTNNYFLIGTVIKPNGTSKDTYLKNDEGVNLASIFSKFPDLDRKYFKPISKNNLSKLIDCENIYDIIECDLIKYFKFDKNKNNIEYLIHALRHGSINIFKKLLPFISIKKLNECYDFEDSLFGTEYDNLDYFITPLLFTLYTSKMDFFKLLIDKGVNVNGSSADEYTPLTFALEYNKIFIDYLLKSGADVNFDDVDGCTPMFKAIELKDIENIKKLIIWGSNLKFDDDDNTYINYIVENYSEKEYIEIFEYLIKFSDLDNIIYDESALLNSIRGRKYKFTKLLIEAGANVNICIIDNQSEELISAILTEKLDIIELLIKVGATYDIISMTELINDSYIRNKRKIIKLLTDNIKK